MSRPETFRRGVNLYIRKFSYSNATAEDFWKALGVASGRPVEHVMPSFVDQPGVPLISVKASLHCTTAGTESLA